MSVRKEKELSFDDKVQHLTSRKAWEDFFQKTPCVKSSYLWGIGCGALMMAHKARIYPGRMGLAVNWGVLTFLAVSGGSFIKCADEVNKKYEAVRLAMENQKQFKEFTEMQHAKRPSGKVA
eukprot:gene7614-9116_t